MKVSDPTHKANIFNEFFINVCAQNSTQSIPSSSLFDNQRQDHHPLSNLEPTNPNEIRDIISSLDSNTAAGHDGIKAHFLKSNIAFFSDLLSKFINECFTQGSFPDVLKIARVTPIHKEGSKDDPNNYRPISILSIFSKIFEIVIRKRLEFFLQSNKILNENQFGFLKKSSTSSATTNLINEIVTRTNNKLKTACLFVDLRKAFDCLKYSTLGEILYNLGIQDQALQLIMSYLTNRQQYVVCGEVRSSLGQVIGGIPQGSVLGPLLFLVYINGIFSLKLNGFIQLYADDMAIVFGEKHFTQLKQKMTEDLSIIIPWLSSINFSINFKKTKFIIFRNAHTATTDIFHSVKFQNDSISAISNYDYLGLTIDQYMTWTNHISKVSRKISFFVYQLKRIRHAINRKTLEMIYFAYIKSHLTYLLPIWGSAADTHIKCLQVLQNKAIKFMRFLPADTASSSLYDNSFLSMKQQYQYESTFLIHKIRLNLIKCNVPLITNVAVTGRNTRSANLLRIPQFLTNQAQRSVFYKGLETYNSLPNDLKSIASISLFKSRLKAHVSHSVPPI
jgi:hypothetical protein